jgi:hypothetical protein
MTQNTLQENAPGALPGMVCGIVGAATTCVPFSGIVLGIIAIVFYVKANRRITESRGKLGGKGMATAGLICGIVAVFFGVMYLIYWLVYGLIIGALISSGIFSH